MLHKPLPSTVTIHERDLPRLRAKLRSKGFTTVEQRRAIAAVRAIISQNDSCKNRQT